jgi:hypothetical protein
MALLINFLWFQFPSQGGLQEWARFFLVPRRKGKSKRWRAAVATAILSVIFRETKMSQTEAF